MADLLGADPGGIVFGRSMTQLTFDMARTFAQDWGPGDEVVVTPARPRRQHPPLGDRRRARRRDRPLARLRPRGPTELDDIETVLSDRTRLVAVTAASNLFGTRPDVPAIARAAHEVGALVYVDAVHLAAHAPVDMAALGADLLACSPYKFFGPHLGALAASPALLETLRPDKLLPSSRRGAGALRARHAALRAARRGHRGGRLHRRPRLRRRRPAHPGDSSR